MRVALAAILLLVVLAVMAPMAASNDWMRTTNQIGTESIIAQLKCINEIYALRASDGPLCQESTKKEGEWKQREKNPPWYVCYGTKLAGSQWTECTK